MMTSRTIGYQEKNVKQSTAPMRKPYADRLRRTFGPRRPAAAGRAPPGRGLGLAQRRDICHRVSCLLGRLASQAA